MFVCEKEKKKMAEGQRDIEAITLMKTNERYSGSERKKTETGTDWSECV